MEKFVNNYENKMPCDRGDLDADFPWRLSGHGKKEAGGEMLEYSIVDEKKVPAEMTERIAGMEETPFQIMYVQGDRLYVGQGYGRQEMEGYAIRVDGCTEEKDVICVQTTLLGPGSDETEKDGEEMGNICMREDGFSQYPYVVLEMAKSEKPVIFE